MCKYLLLSLSMWQCLIFQNTVGIELLPPHNFQLPMRVKQQMQNFLPPLRVKPPIILYFNYNVIKRGNYCQFLDQVKNTVISFLSLLSASCGYEDFVISGICLKGILKCPLYKSILVL